MTGTRAVQVVLGEGEPGILRLVLEAQGFHVVGHARGDGELREVIAVTRPAVIVLDAGISAAAMHEAQIRSDYAPIVVVWPKDTVTSVAEERVDPSLAVLELGNAVRRVVARHAGSERIPGRDPAVDRDASDEATIPEPFRRRRPSGRARHALVLVAAWTISLTALTAIGVAVPGALRALRPAGTRHTSIGRPELGLTSDRGRSAPGTARTNGGSSPSEPGCAAPAKGPSSRRPASAEDRQGRGCALGRGGHDTPGGRERGHGHGRPDDPNAGSGRNANGGPEANGHGGGSTDPKPEPDGRNRGDGNDDHGGSDGGPSGNEGGGPSGHGGEG